MIFTPEIFNKHVSKLTYKAVQFPYGGSYLYIRQNLKIKQTYTSHFFETDESINSYFHFIKLQL